MSNEAAEVRRGELLELAGGDANELAKLLVKPVRVITVRLPRSFHAALIRSAHAHQTSLNKLCVRRLMEEATLADAADIAAWDEIHAAAARAASGEERVSHSPVPAA